VSSEPPADAVLVAEQAHPSRARADLARMRAHTREVLDTQHAGATTS